MKKAPLRLEQKQSITQGRRQIIQHRLKGQSNNSRRSKTVRRKNQEKLDSENSKEVKLKRGALRQL